jgi:hypothetical protein
MIVGNEVSVLRCEGPKTPEIFFVGLGFGFSF